VNFISQISYLLTVLVLFAISGKGYAVIKAKPYPWFRLHGEAHNMKVDRKYRHIAFTDPEGHNLSYLDMKRKKIFRVTRQKTGPSFFFSPDGYRIFYSELVRSKKHPVLSIVKVYDIGSRKSIEIQRLESLSGFLTFDPRDLRFQLMHPGGILTKMIVFPDERLAKWQLAQRTEQGKWLATQKGILWLTHSGFTMRKLKDDESGIQAFDISPDGSSMVWATKKASIFYSQLGSKPGKIGDGYDPSWHPQKPLVIFAGIRRIGTKIISTDVRITDTNGEGRWITFSQSASERWPRWINQGGSLIYSLARTTDIYRIDLKR
jgi:hypothetical protein